MYDDEDRGNPDKMGTKRVILGHGNWTSWMHFIVNMIKGLKSPELEIMVTTGTKPTWIPPTMDDEILEEDQMVRVYTDDTAGIEDCNHDRAEYRKRKAFFFAILPKAVSMTYSTIGNDIIDKMRIEKDYEEA